MQLLSKDLRDELSRCIKPEILKVELLSGGDINKAFKVSTAKQAYFLKVNSAKRFPKMFEIEARSLSVLKESSAFQIPNVIHTGIAVTEQYLLLEWLEPSNSEAFFEAFAKNLAKMHLKSSETFGLDFNNYIGSLAQKNSRTESWIDFYISERIEEMLKLAKVPKVYFSKFNKLFAKLDKLLHLEVPALLHGDLWSGNVIQNANELTVIDPAIYYGNREVDLAMTALFGGFPNEFYQAYQAAFPLEMGWQDRLELYQLYPLLVHVNLFGESYLSGIEQTLKKYT